MVIFIPSELGFTMYSWFLLSLVLPPLAGKLFFCSENLPTLLDEPLDFELESESPPQC